MGEIVYEIADHDMNEYPIARMFRDSRVQRIYGGANEIMKVLIARTL
jgi:acyl-CoA dehydrogenase